MKELISVIMSVYNETNSELLQSINSILEQTYKNIEFIIVNDNPENKRIREVLRLQKDPRIKIINNKKNMGIVSSLNVAIQQVKGNYIARMDADDVSINNRLEMEYNYLVKNNLDLIGSWVRLIDNSDEYIGEIQFPTTTNGIRKQIKYRGCMAHPTWFGKTEVFYSLNGYRHMIYCEDYDFILRALLKGYKLGNIPYYGLKYRIRENGISLSNKNKQLLNRRYLSKNMKNIFALSEKHLENFMESEMFSKELSRLKSFEVAKTQLDNFNVVAIIKLLKNKNLYIFLYEKLKCYVYSKLYK